MKALGRKRGKDCIKCGSSLKLVMVPTLKSQFLEASNFLKGKVVNTLTTQEVPASRNIVEGFSPQIPRAGVADLQVVGADPLWAGSHPLVP